MIEERKSIIFNLWKSIFLSFVCIVLLATSTYAYYKNVYTYEGGTFSTGEFEEDQIIDGNSD